MAAGILIPQERNFSDWSNPSALPNKLRDSLLVRGCEDGRMLGWGFAWRCEADRCEQADDAETTATMRGISLYGEHGKVACIYGGNFPNEKARFDRVN